MLPKKILFCTDFSENSLPACELAKEYAKAFGAGLIVVHVVNTSRMGYPAFQQDVPFDQQAVLKSVEESVTGALDEVAEDCRKMVNSVEAYYRMGIPATEIVSFAKEESVDLLVLGTHGWTGITHLVMGSTAENVVRTAGCPVLTVRSGEPS
jgi:universal stress protein A